MAPLLAVLLLLLQSTILSSGNPAIGLQVLGEVDRAGLASDATETTGLSVDSPPEVTTTCGPAVGTWLTVPPSPISPVTTRVAAFYSLPYAAPPIDSLRWAAPTKPDCWTGTYNATEMRGYCVQGGGDGQEDCLYLHVYVKEAILDKQPKQHPSERRGVPTFFYIHGGGLTGGSANFEPLTAFAAHVGAEEADGGAVVVAINYRLNIFGFLATEELSQAAAGQGADVPAANFGLLDQQLALQWVQSNIAAFGGDPTRVTIAGQSSGGTSIFGLLSSPASNGLFAGAIALSGSINTSMTIEQGWTQNRNITTDAGCGGLSTAEATVACLRAASISTLISAQPPSWSTPQLWGIENLTAAGRTAEFGGLVFIDKLTITHGFGDALAIGLVDVPLIISNMGQECDIGPDTDVSALTPTEWLAYLETAVGGFNLPEMARTLFQLYPMGDAGDAQKSYDDLNTDYGLTCGTVQLAYGAKLGAYKSPVYITVNQWAPSHPIPTGSWNITYAYHTWDYLTALESFPLLWTPTDADWQLSQLLQQTWFSLMSTGSLASAPVKWSSFEQAVGFPDAYATFVFQAGNASQVIVDYKAGTCAVLEGLGFNQNFWWVD